MATIGLEYFDEEAERRWTQMESIHGISKLSCVPWSFEDIFKEVENYLLKTIHEPEYSIDLLLSSDWIEASLYVFDFCDEIIPLYTIFIRQKSRKRWITMMIVFDTYN